MSAAHITAQFCGSKKSLVHGTVFAKILFPIGFPIGIIFLPLMLFHAFQIFTVSVFPVRLWRLEIALETLECLKRDL